jgi:DNA repair protein RadC
MYVKEITGDYRQATPAEILAAATRAARQIFRRGRVIESVDDSRNALFALIGDREHEVFGVLFLDNRHRVIEFREMFNGTIDAASVHPRVIVQAAMRLNAAAVILAHNHPSGIDQPSRADEAITSRIKEVLGMVDVRVLDHIIVTPCGMATSFSERGLL